MTENVLVQETVNSVYVYEAVNEVIVSIPGTQGPRGRTILNGDTAPSNNNGLEGDFYFNKTTNEFYGPKMSDITWDGANKIVLSAEAQSFEYAWEIAQLGSPVNGIYSIEIQHNLGFRPNVTVKTSSGDILETGIIYNSATKLTLQMAQPFAGTAYLS